MGAAPRHPIPPGDCRCWRPAARRGRGQNLSGNAEPQLGEGPAPDLSVKPVGLV